MDGASQTTAGGTVGRLEHEKAKSYENYLQVSLLFSLMDTEMISLLVCNVFSIFDLTAGHIFKNEKKFQD